MTNIQELPCPQCGIDSDNFDQGVCAFCCSENQLELNAYNLNFDRWSRLSDRQRKDEIEKAD